MSNPDPSEENTSIDPFQHTSTSIPLDTQCRNAQITVDTCEETWSVWNYFKWLFWAVISGFFRCGKSLTFPPIDDQWLIAPPEQEETITEFAPECDVRGSYQIPADSATISVVVNENFCLKSTEQLCSVAYVEDNPKTEIPPKSTEYSVEKNKAKFSADSFEGINTWSDLSSLSLDNFQPWDYSNGYLAEQSTVNFSTYTLLSSLHQSSVNGVIDTANFEHSVDKLLQSVIPRNLSDCSDVSVRPEIRKMYAWNKTPNDCTHESPNQSSEFGKSIGRCDSDQQIAYPGRLSMSDAPSPPMSPSTLDSNTPTGESPCTQISASDMILLPLRPNREQTLAWAISTLKLDSNGTANRAYSPTRQSRQSRDKSPVSTVNSMRIPDYSSSPDFLPFSGTPLQEKSFSFLCEPTPKPKRSSSLKSQRTPPGTPGPKSVRFADTLGLDLESVRHVFDQEVPPKIPASATFGLELDKDESIAKLGAKQFGLCFPQPGVAPNFIRRVLSQNVCLEDAHANLPRGVLTGTIRVRSLGFEKHVFVRITYNNWATYCDTPASYVQGSHDGATDRFAFSVVFPDTMIPGDRAQFAVRYETHTGEQFWDNNHGQNYAVACYAKATDLAGDGSWVHYL